MMRPNLISLLALVLLRIRGAHCGNYMFDKSCAKTTIMDGFIRTSFSNALLMATAGYTASQQNPVDPAVQQVLDWLINNQPANMAVTQAAYARTVLGPTGIGRFTNEVTDTDALGLSDVKIYCDFSRIKKKMRAKLPFYYYIDTDLDPPENIEPEDMESCLDGTLAYTVQTDMTVGTGFYQIQISDYYIKALVGYIKEKVSEHRGYTEIDTYSLFDKVVVHELTHANYAWATEDVIINGEKAYGWPLCTALSTRPRTAGQHDSAEWNADTWALFASIAYQLQTGKITSMNVDGTMNFQ